MAAMLLPAGIAAMAAPTRPFVQRGQRGAVKCFSNPAQHCW